MPNHVVTPPLLVPDPGPGKLLFADDFSLGTGVPWTKTGAGTGALTRDTATWTQGGASMKITSSTVVSENTEYHRFVGPRNAAGQQPSANSFTGGSQSPIYARNIGEVVFGGTLAFMDQNAANFGVYLGYRDGTNWVRGKLLFVLNAGWQIQFDAGGSGGANLVQLSNRNIAIQSAYPIWHRWELIVDFSSGKYVGASFDDLDFSSQVAGVPLRSAADATNKNVLDFALDTTNIGGAPAASVQYVDTTYAYQRV